MNTKKGRSVSKRATALINKLTGAAQKFAFRGSDYTMAETWTEMFKKAKADLKDYIAELEKRAVQ